ncbi:MAG: site-specific DNA-methyltransferase [Myxococcaceae bacterium]|nr:site-specific DNA-methyltransferase [Myxococcaceae bacterium]MCI0669844.1 site-specific DNA-methyltransferase [Myxococcaceae bacterium]
MAILGARRTVDGNATSGQEARTVHCEDAVAWLSRQPVWEGWSAITSLPDVSEVAMELPAWRAWFVDCAALLLSRVPPDGVAVFYQTDIKREGTWVDKGYLCQQAAEREGCALLWHKVVCRRPPGTVTFGRPAWAHLLCFSRGVRVDLARSTADVLPETGEMTWSRAMGLAACVAAVRWVRENTRSHTVVDPFCGEGSVLAVANALGLSAVGVELSRRRCRRARNLRVELPEAAPPRVARFSPA